MHTFAITAVHPPSRVAVAVKRIRAVNHVAARARALLLFPTPEVHVRRITK